MGSPAYKEEEHRASAASDHIGDGPSQKRLEPVSLPAPETDRCPDSTSVANKPHPVMPSVLSRPLTLSGILAVLALAVGLVLFGSESPSTDTSTTIRPTQVGSVVWHSPVEVAAGGGYRGPWRMNESDWRFVDDPSVALGPDGSTGVVWTDHVEQDLFFQAYDASGAPTFPSPVNVSQNPETFSWLPRILIPKARPNTVYILWQEIIFSGGTHGGEALFARSTDGGRSFSDPINLSRSEAGDGKGRLTQEYWHNGSLDLAVGPAGTVYAAWTEYEGRLWLSRSTNRGVDFSDPVHVSGTNARPARGPSLGVDTTGTVHLAWAVGERARADIQYTHSTSSWRTFAPPRPIDETDGHSDAPSLAVDRAGTVHVAYGESPTGPFRQYHVRYTHLESEGEGFRRPTRLSNAPSDTVDRAHFPTLRVQSSDTLHVVWERFPDDGPRSVGLTYAASVNGGDTFTRPTLIPGSADAVPGFNGSQQGLLMEKLAVNEAGSLAVVNSTFDRGESSHIWLHRGTTVE